MIAALVLAAPTIAAPAKKARPNPNAGLIAEAKREVANRLLDPSAAQFRDVRVKPGDGGKIVCGDFNGKNRYGGYVGFTTFVYARGQVLTQEDAEYPEIALSCYE